MEESRVGFNMALADRELLEARLNHVISGGSTNGDYVLSSFGSRETTPKAIRPCCPRRKVMRDTSFSSDGLPG
jgi:hypothetical protein